MINKNKLINDIHNQPKVVNEKLIDFKQKTAEKWFLHLRNVICDSFLKLEKKYSENNTKINNKTYDFEKKKWLRDGGGGGVMSTMRGDLFEKVGVNISTVYGQFSEAFKSQIPGAEKTGRFWASGISVVAHMSNPKIPAAHMNTRFLVTGEGSKMKTWFGGGCDLTPMTNDKKAEKLFHSDIKKMCDRYNKNYYEDYKLWCDEYFFLPHRNEPRGIGGIFFDYLNSLDWDKDLEFAKDVGLTFSKVYSNIIKERMFLDYSKKDKLEQLEKRGRYVEFNLLYDRGTVFGLKTGGNPEAILMSLPPQVSWK